MFNKNFRPLPDVISIKCNYDHLPYRIRQKIKAIQHDLLDIRSLSKNKGYRLYLFDDACCLVDGLRNKILWTFDYLSSMAVLKNRLTDLKRLYLYETHCINLKNSVQINDYKTLQKMYYYGC